MEQPLLFSDLLAPRPRVRGAALGLGVSLACHGLVVPLLVLAVTWPTPPPDHRDYVVALGYNPPPAPPPPPLLFGRGLLAETVPKSAAVERRPSRKPPLVVPFEPTPAPRLPSPEAVADAGLGSPTGSEQGVPEGMEEGVFGGVPGGVPGGVLSGVVGGVLGGTGEGPVADYDHPPRPLRITQPTYPHEAFVKKVVGTVVLEILIDAEGRVARARVVASIPLLDRAAVAAVEQWVFVPAMKDGHPVPTLARAPIYFRIL